MYFFIENSRLSLIQGLESKYTSPMTLIHSAFGMRYQWEAHALRLLFHISVFNDISQHQVLYSTIYKTIKFFSDVLLKIKQEKMCIIVKYNL